jgi:hypothetical protein
LIGLARKIAKFTFRKIIKKIYYITVSCHILPKVMAQVAPTLQEYYINGRLPFTSCPVSRMKMSTQLTASSLVVESLAVQDEKVTSLFTGNQMPKFHLEVDLTKPLILEQTPLSDIAYPCVLNGEGEYTDGKNKEQKITYKFTGVCSQQTMPSGKAHYRCDCSSVVVMDPLIENPTQQLEFWMVIYEK